MTETAYTGARIFDGTRLHDGLALVLSDGRVTALRPDTEIRDLERVDLGGGILAPGLVDLQVNGGGGVMLNDHPDVRTLRVMAEAHGRLGSTTIVPTLITDTREVTLAAIDAIDAAIAEGVPGVGGLHLEGPHLDPAKAGAHDPALIRPMDDADLAMLVAAARRLPTLIVTLAPGAATPDQIGQLRDAGAIVSLGHSAASYEEAASAVAAGASMVTHLYNAMSQLGHRSPGLVGAALDRDLWAGIIADGVHVHPAALRIAVVAKPQRLFLVSDAMAVAGTDATRFTLNGREITRSDGRLTLEDGTLAGADLDLPRAMRMLLSAGSRVENALALATSRPADAIGRGDLGYLQPGSRGDMVHLSDDLDLRQVWRAGQPI
ncbi:N-acetylglucosamine-6-phosphate deacetylase [Roseivivax halodurans JCM 10272]|uniref:N-acetylglucosamine-6-phosphate deacetylase n=1 Tax=Roseivivax halodurans JCM 10272 TaxID=1449350 RepID=X7EFC0_9RHOB|nr:N-acetylglucosamine-6-phosphate deacetylase [Roseivivax halodurans]ETX14784.1 N-acetylglucosamine-6-phosphate deacetylase [Roseivivax halodurans JCM 10272]